MPVDPIAQGLLSRLLNFLGGWALRWREDHERRRKLNPLVLRQGGAERHFSWVGRGAVHLVPQEEPARQLYDFFTPLCDEIRLASGKEPQFDLPNKLTGDVVFELSDDMRAKWRLLGGMGGDAGTAVLVVTNKPAK